MAKDNKKCLLVAQEIKLVKILAGNNKKLRERTIKRLGKWLIDRTAREPLDEDGFMRIWKGLFYTMWMSDKMLIQEDCAEKISNLIHLGDTNASLLFFKCFLTTMLNEWYGIDQHRIDKFLMLIRRVFRQGFEVLNQCDWDSSYVKKFTSILSETLLLLKNSSLGFGSHINELYLEEIAKVSKGKISSDIILELIRPFALQMVQLDDVKHVEHIKSHIFKYLMNQSDLGIEHKEKFEVWKRQGFPGGTLDSLESVPIEDDDDDLPEENCEELFDGPKDPRAGKVDVVLPQLQFDPNTIVDLLEGLKFQNTTTTIARKTIINLINQFSLFAKGTFPLGIHKITVNKPVYSTKLKSAVKRLQNLEQNLTHDSKKAKAKIKRRKQVEEIKKELNLLANKNEEKLVKKKPKPTVPRVNDNKKENRKLKRSIEANEAVQTKKKKVKSSENVINDENNCFEDENQFVRNSGLWTVNKFEIPPSPKYESEWSKPLENGETEYFIMSKKAKNKLKRLAEMKNRKVSNIVENYTNQIMNGKPKKNKIIVKNPFSQQNTPVKQKKITFSNKIQKQEFKEHQKQVSSSPIIPYDGKKKPTKSLLKPSPFSSPINPFFKIKTK